MEQSNQLQITEHILGKTEHCHGNNTKNYTTHIGDGREKEMARAREKEKERNRGYGLLWK